MWPNPNTFLEPNLSVPKFSTFIFKKAFTSSREKQTKPDNDSLLRGFSRDKKQNKTFS